MNIHYKVLLAVIALIASIGVGSSTCSSGCDQVAPATIEQGHQVHLQGPATSPQGRPLDYEWRIYLCDGTDVSTAIFGGPETSQNLYFISPPYGDYKVALTVRDQEFPTTCYDVKTICGSSTQGACPSFCCGNTCEKDTTSPRGSCPYNFVYTGISVDNYEYRWLVDGFIYKRGTGDTNKQVTIEWTASSFIDASLTPTSRPLNVGDHAVSFEIWAPDPANPAVLKQIKLCPSLCNIYKVQKPTANIALLV
jgi:hypothetical protein